MKTRVLLAACGLLLSGIGPAAATAEPELTPVGGDRLISASIDDEGAPQVVWNATANQYLVVWRDGRNAARGMEIYGRRVGADGVPIGTEDFRISGPNATANEYSPQVVWNATANQYLVVWRDGRSVASRGYEVYGRRVGAGGVPIGTDDFRVSTSTSDEWSPQVVWNATANQYLVVWRDHRSVATRGYEIYGRRVGAGGRLIGTDDFLISTSTASEWSPQVAWNAIANQYLVVWQDHRSEATRGYEIYGRRVGAGGVPIGTDDFLISTSTANEYAPQVVWNATANQYLVVWGDSRSVIRGSDIYGRRVGADGVPLGRNVRISGPNATADEKAAAVAWNGTANQYMVVWEDERSEATRGWEIYGRRFAGDPAP